MERIADGHNLLVLGIAWPQCQTYGSFASVAARKDWRTCTFTIRGIRCPVKELSGELALEVLSPTNEVPHGTLRARSSIG